MIPSELRNDLGVSEGDEFSARVEDGRLVLETGAAALSGIRKKLSEGAGSRSLAGEVIERRRADARIEETRIDRQTGRT